jgi:protein-tyrosine phosphatase
VIDLHCHILPNVDDGASSLDVSREMLLAARKMGFKTIVATPHLTGPLDHDYERHVNEAFSQVLPIARHLGLWLLPGYEIRLNPQLADRLIAGEPATMVNTRTVLVDLATMELPHFVDDALFALQTAGFQPIFAHPERYPDIQKNPELGVHLAQRGIALQVTIGSLAGAFGSRARKAAEMLLRLGAVHLVATDAHSAGHRLAAVPEGLRRLRNLLDAEQYQRVLIDAPHALISGEPLPQPVTAIDKGLRSRLQLFR